MQALQSQTALLVGSEKIIGAIGSLLGNTIEKTSARSGSEARQKLITRDRFDLAIIKTPLSDEFGDDLALSLAERGIAVVLLISAEHLDEYAVRLSESGVVTVAVPIVRQLFVQSVNLALCCHARVARLRQENEKLTARLAEMQQVCRAKCLLVQYEGMSESDSHRYIEKRAMDLRLPRSDVAAMIVARYADP